MNTTLDTKTGRIIAYLEAWFVDHEILRKLYRNFYKISEDTFRSNHPSPGLIRKLHKKYAIKTIVSLRAADTTGQYLLEKEACDKLGIKLTHLVTSSRDFPKKETVLKAKEILENVEYPILIHCKSGADRAGLMSVFYKHFIGKESIEKSLQQLHVKYGHFRWAETGKLDIFFESFVKFEKQNPNISFLQWVENHYDKEEMNKEFHAKGWANILVNKILHRE